MRFRRSVVHRHLRSRRRLLSVCKSRTWKSSRSLEWNAKIRDESLKCRFTLYIYLKKNTQAKFEYENHAIFLSYIRVYIYFLNSTLWHNSHASNATFWKLFFFFIPFRLLYLRFHHFLLFYFCFYHFLLFVSIFFIFASSFFKNFIFIFIFFIFVFDFFTVVFLFLCLGCFWRMWFSQAKGHRITAFFLCSLFLSSYIFFQPLYASTFHVERPLWIDSTLRLTLHLPLRHSRGDQGRYSSIFSSSSFAWMPSQVCWNTPSVSLIFKIKKIKILQF